MATTTVNISLPTNLKKDADGLIAEGEFASFSDLARSGIRQIVLDRKYKMMIEEAKREEALGLSTVLSGPEEIEKYVKSLGK